MRKVAITAAVFVAAAIPVLGGQKAHAETNQQPKKQPKIVNVRSGDSLSKIARRNKTTYPRLYDANPKIDDPDLIYVGDKIRIPGKDEKLKKRPLENYVSPSGQTDASNQPEEPAQTSWQPAPPAPAPAQSASVTGNIWDRLAQCESGGNWSINTGNGYYGGLQFTLSTWQSVGGSGYPHQASRSEQIKRGQILQARSGWGQWPACTAMLGLR